MSRCACSNVLGGLERVLLAKVTAGRTPALRRHSRAVRGFSRICLDGRSLRAPRHLIALMSERIGRKIESATAPTIKIRKMIIIGSMMVMTLFTRRGMTWL